MAEPRMKGGRKWQGAKWCRPAKRWAIYHRDGFACVYCGASSRLSLDHVVPEEHGGDHDASNLVTSCFSCNSARGARSMRDWLSYLRAAGEATDGIARRIRQLTRRPIDRAVGQRLVQLTRAA